MTSYTRFRDRREAGQVLAAALRDEDLGGDPVLLALPRGGVPVAAEISAILQLPLEVFLVRKLGVPGQSEYAMGAIASGGVQVLDESLIVRTGIARADVDAVLQHETAELRRREQIYGAVDASALAARAAVVVDDGIATGFTVRAAVEALRRMGCPRVSVAAPVGARSTCVEFAPMVDRLVCPLQPDDFFAVGQWYDDFSPTADEEVLACLARTRRAG